MPPDKDTQPEHAYGTPGSFRLSVNPLTLSFQDNLEHLESQFHKQYFDSNLRYLRLIHLIAILFYGLTGLLENILLPEALQVLWTVRYGIVIPIIIIGLGFTYTSYYKKCWYLISAIYILATGGGFVVMIILGPKPEIYSYYVGIIICLFFGYTFARERFVYASLSGCSLLIVYFFTSIYFVDTPLKILLHNVMYIFIANFLGMIICYFIEYTARRDFFLVHLYKEEREKATAVNLELEKRVKERTLDLTESNLRLKEEIKAHQKAEKQKEELETHLQRAQKMESLGTLAGGVAHDLNNILTGVVSYPDLLLTELPEDSSFRDALLIIKSSGEKAAAIVQDLLTLARRGVAISTVVNLNVIIKDYFRSPEFLKLKTYHPKVEYKVELKDGLHNIMGSTVHLSKTIMNLISNASESMPEGGTIKVVSENTEINSPIKGYPDIKNGSYNVITVSDKGVGIAPEEMERIFEPFYTKKVMGRSGTGLGMAVVWGTVHDHKGYIEIKSTPGKGSTFLLYFPSTDQQIPAVEEHLSMDKYKGNGEAILVVDDVQEQRKIANKILTKLGYSVTTSSSGEEAVKYMKNHSADLVIVDMIMDPGIDGLETYHQIIEYHPNQKVIIASGFSETGRVEEMQRLGAGEYVRKPYSMEKIGMAVKKTLAA
ncbi:MAG: response regulator [Desulfosarcina sp.]|nr:response regulator [Desulfosarcina sp.]MBC2743874.1 response regulator [Desulfosarcina sp.]MBC2766783.1 response regulator [Desulfosarcina sp.]